MAELPGMGPASCCATGGDAVMVVYALRAVCPIDGYGLRGGTHVPVTVNKRSLRQTGFGLTWADRYCPECGQRTDGQTFTVAGLTAQDQATVEQYRRQRWPDLFGECHWCGASIATTRARVLPLHTDTAGRRCKGTGRAPMRPVLPCRARYATTAHLPAGETTP